VRHIASLVATSLLLALPALATVNHGDFIGTGVDFLAVSETTQTAGDAEPLWDAPSLGGAGDQLLFFPTNFTSTCTVGASDVTESVLETTISAQAGVHIETLMLQEAGDAILTSFPPFGTPATNASAGISGTLTVTHDTSGPIAPVVIPITATFMPSDTFALPTDFGTSGWTGNVVVDVASAVPNATVAELSLVNTLATNCDAGNTSSTIQKKSVAGPSVALMVNPIECELEIDKTCCVTQPVLPDLGACEGDMVSMTLEYTGDSCHASTNDQGHAFRCLGRRRVGEPADIDVLWDAGEISATPDTGVMKGDQVVFTSSDGTLNRRTKIKVSGPWWRRQYLKIDTSCDRAFQCGDQFGAFEVVGFESTAGGVVDCSAPPPPPECASSGDPVGTPCDAKLIDMVLEYNGQDCQDPLGNPQNGEASCDGDATGASDVSLIYTGKFGWRQTVSPSSGINDGDRIRVTATFRNGLFPNQSFKIVDSGGVRQTVDFHISCSQPLALGDEFGSLELVEFTTKNGTQAALGDPGAGPADACEVPLAPPGPHCTSDLQELTLVYIGDFLGEGCTVSNSQGGFGTCSGVADPGDPVSVSVGGYGLEVSPTDTIEFGDLVTVNSGSGSGDLPAFVTLDVTGDGGSQSLQIKTSCHKPLSLGDRFGSFVVFGMDREDEGPITLGGNVQYQYTVTNPNADPVDGVEVVDDQLGVVASGESLAAGEVRTFVQPATLFGTTTNVATVTGEVMGAVCAPGTDQVTVGVSAPPPGAFFCSGPISELTMVWNGAQTVLVKAWDGDPGSSVLVNQFEDVAPGDAITASGFSGQDTPIWQIFDQTGTTLLGYSAFDLWCGDKSMNGIEDCGKNNGNLKANHPSYNNDWLFEGMVDSDETLACTPGLVPNPPACGFGPELLLVLPGLLVVHRRRLRRE